MLSKEELAAFLALLTSFATKLALSELMLAKLIGVSHTTTVRWMKIARGEAEGGVYRHAANPIIELIERADKLNEERGLYEAVKDQRPGAKVESIQLALRNRIW